MGDILEVLFREAVEFILGTICFYTGKILLRSITLGRYPGQTVSIKETWVISTLGLLVWVGVAVWTALSYL